MREVSRLDLAAQPTGEKDRVFFSQGSLLIGLTRKMKDFLRHDTQIADPIRHVLIEGTTLFTAGDYLLNQYELINDQVKTSTFYLSDGKINDIALHYITT